MAKSGPGEELRGLLKAALSTVDAADPAALAAALAGFRRRALAAAEDRFGPGQSGVPCSRFICGACDMLVREAAAGATRAAGAARAAGAGHSEGGGPDLRVAWVATGAYGRGFMSPGSTIRLVLLHAGEDPDAAGAMSCRLVELLARAGADALSVPRTVAEATRRMTEDPVTALAMLSTRLVAGDKRRHGQLREAIRDEFLPSCWGRLGDEVLREALSVRDPFTGSPYCIEPNLKDGAGCLRDIGTVQELAACLAEVPGLRGLPGGPTDKGPALLSSDELAELQEAFDLILRARNRLHFLHEGRSDVLYRASQAQVACALGMRTPAGDGDAALLMRQLFRRTGRVARLLRVANERFQHLYRVAWQEPAPLGRRDLGDGYVEVQGQLYSSARPPFEGGHAAARMMRLFCVSQRRHLPVSQELLDQVAEHLPVASSTAWVDKEVGAAFLDLLAGSVGVAERVAWMRDCGLLQTYVPEFAPLVHAVAPEAASDHTLDEHAIEALRIMDDLGHTRERAELAQRETLEQVERPDLLRLATLLHDAPAVSNAATGRLAGQVTDRIGLKPADRQDLLFLLDNVRTLWTHAESRAFEDGAAVRGLASAVGPAERLRMLYLMTYAHARAAGPLGWFAWRDAQLYELYQTLMVILVPEYKPFATTQYFVREFEELARREGLAEAAADFLPLVPDLYKTEVSPAEALAHLELVRRTRSRPAAITWTLEAQEATLWTCTSDVPARFSQIAAVLTCNGLDITSATAFTLKDGTVLDRFGVHMKGRPINPDPAFWRRVEEDLVLTIRGELDAAEAARRRAAGAATAEAVSSLRLVTTVHFDNRSSARFTIVDIATRDRPGLLFEIAGALSAMGLNIELARVRTRADLAQDVFFVTDARTGGRVTDEGRLKAVRERLLEVTAPARAAL